GTADWKWHSTKVSRWPPMSRFTSAIRKVHGSAAQTKTRTGCYGNTRRRRRTFPPSPTRTRTKSLCDSINAHARPWDFKPRRIDCKPVLRRSLETTGVIGSYVRAVVGTYLTPARPQKLNPCGGAEK